MLMPLMLYRQSRDKHMMWLRLNPVAVTLKVHGDNGTNLNVHENSKPSTE